MPKELDTETVDEETQSNFDMGAATAAISDELFGQGGDTEEKTLDDSQAPEGESSTEEEQSQDSSETHAVEEGSAPQTPVEEENSAAVQETGAPKTWNKEELATWATVPPEIQAKLTPILQRREDDFLRGIQGYKAAADLGVAYSKVIEPYAPILAAENVDPVGLFQSFAGNHYLLSRGTDEQKVRLAAELINGYKIPLQGLLEYIADAGTAAPKDPYTRELEERLGKLESGLTAKQTEEQEQTRTRLVKEINEFAADPAHSYFEELANDITKLFGTGAVDTLQDAYDRACWSNPAVREKMLAARDGDRQAALEKERQEKTDKRRKSTADHVAVKSTNRDGTVPKGSIDDTLNETFDRMTAE